MVSGVLLLAAAPMVIAASSQASNRLFDVASAGPVRSGRAGREWWSTWWKPGIVPVFISDWYIAAFSGDASMVEPS